MTDRIALAARNNALWCDAVCRAHGLITVLDDLAWTSRTRTPPYYPDAVTLSPVTTEYDVLARIDPGDGASIKDSWSRFDLTTEDFARLLVGEWLWFDTPDIDADGRVWRRIDGTEFTAWASAWARDPEDAAILRPGLLDEPGVHVLAASDGDDPFAAGAIVNVTAPVAGISNTFSRDADEVRAWRGVTRAAHELVGTMPFVGWEAGDGVLAAVEAGCERLGPLTVWIS